MSAQGGARRLAFGEGNIAGLETRPLKRAVVRALRKAEPNALRHGCR
jgi:hypothetical protein